MLSMTSSVKCKSTLLFANDVVIFFVVFPSGCTNFEGPHSLQCLQSVWVNVGCFEEGIGYPKSLESLEINGYDRLNLKLV